MRISLINFLPEPLAGVYSRFRIWPSICRERDCRVPRRLGSFPKAMQRCPGGLGLEAARFAVFLVAFGRQREGCEGAVITGGLNFGAVAEESCDCCICSVSVSAPELSVGAPESKRNRSPGQGLLFWGDHRGERHEGRSEERWESRNLLGLRTSATRRGSRSPQRRRARLGRSSPCSRVVVPCRRARRLTR